VGVADGFTEDVRQAGGGVSAAPADVFAESNESERKMTEKLEAQDRYFLRKLSLIPALLLLQSCVDLFTCRADWKFFWVAIGDPLLSTERTDGLACYGGLHDLLFSHVMRETFMIPIVGRHRRGGLFSAVLGEQARQIKYTGRNFAHSGDSTA